MIFSCSGGTNGPIFGEARNIFSDTRSFILFRAYLGAGAEAEMLPQDSVWTCSAGWRLPFLRMTTSVILGSVTLSDLAQDHLLHATTRRLHEGKKNPINADIEIRKTNCLLKLLMIALRNGSCSFSFSLPKDWGISKLLTFDSTPKSGS